MIWLIAKKDFLLNLISVRFIIGFLLCLFVIPFTLVVGVDGFLNQERIYKVEKERADNLWKGIREYSGLRPTIVKEPSPLSIFSKGIGDNIGTEKKINFGEVPLFLDGKTATRDNPFLNAFFSIDFSTVVAILISLLALVFSYDAITREREDGTMKLTFTGQVSRITFLFGKLLGLLLTLLPILIFCYLLATLFVVMHPSIAFSGGDWSGIFLLFLTSVVYMLVFILLGMLISSLTRSSSTSIIISLLCWIWFLFLIPSISSYLAQSIAKASLYENVQIAMNELDNEMGKEEEDKLMEIYRTMGGVRLSHYNFNQGEDGYHAVYGGAQKMVEFHRRLNEWSEPRRIDYADKKWALQKKYQDELVKQQRLQQYLSWLSPSELFKQTTWKLCRTDADSYLSYLETIRKYRETLIQYFRDKKLFGSTTYFTAQPFEVFYTEEQIQAVDTFNDDVKGWNRGDYEPFDVSDVPRYVDVVPTFASSLEAAIGRLAGLLALVVGLLLLTIFSFMKYDVR